MSPPLIREVREADGDDGKLSIVDAPPGSSCPVVHALRGLDFVVLVTEPTPFGLSDLKGVVGVVRKLGIPMGIVVNRADMGDDRVKRYAEQEGIPVLLEIPFDRRVAEAYAAGKPAVETVPGRRNLMATLLEEILKCATAGRTRHV